MIFMHDTKGKQGIKKIKIWQKATSESWFWNKQNGQYLIHKSATQFLIEKTECLKNKLKSYLKLGKNNLFVEYHKPTVILLFLKKTSLILLKNRYSWFFHIIFRDRYLELLTISKCTIDPFLHYHLMLFRFNLN